MTHFNRNLSATLTFSLVISAAFILLHFDSSNDVSAAGQPLNGRIAFTDSNSLLTVNSDGSGLLSLVSDGSNGSPSWKSDGSKIAFSRRSPVEVTTGIFTINPDGTDLQKISREPYNDYQPSWSPDGMRIAFTNALGATPEISVMNADGTNRITLTSNSAVDAFPVWSPDGSRIAFVSSRDFPGITGDVSGGFEVYVMNADGSNQTRLTNNSFADIYPNWSPDSSRITFATNRDGNYEIYSMNADGSTPLNLTNNTSSDFAPVWSPDGNRIAFLSFRDSALGAPQEIFVMNADGTNATRVTTSSLAENELAWQPIQGTPTPTPTPTATPTPAPSPIVVISQLYTRGGTPGATYQASFVELFNRGSSIADLNQWAIRFTSANNVELSIVLTSTRSIPLLPGQYMLLQIGAAGPTGLPVPADITIPTSQLTLASSGKVMLLKAGSVISPTGCPLPNSAIADLVGFGSNTSCFEGTAPVPSLTNTTAAVRKSEGCADTDENGSDFSVSPPTPRNLFSPLHQCNRVDDTEYFVRQHYLDFLNRAPDGPGLAFWKNEISSCGDDVTCVEVKRINVSAAFYLSIEFQQTGYEVYLTHKTAYGLIPGTPVPLRLTEFLPDTQRIGANVIVGASGWEQQLEANKAAFFNDFVTRERFLNRYSTNLEPSSFVDALFSNAGVTPSASERTAVLNEFGGANNIADSAARGRALRRVSENESLARAEFNRAFVLMQYFGYLRRNPNDPPEPNLDFAGYNFWLNKLDQFGGNYVSAEMVKAFTNSTEYRQRFGP